MANSKLENKSYNVPEHLQSFLGSTISYANLKMTKTRMTKAKDNDPTEFQRKGGDATLTWATEALKNDRQAIHSVKKTGMDAGRENQFRKTYERDDNANPTAVGGVPNLSAGNVSRSIMGNSVEYYRNESIDREIKQIRYLMEYMNNKKQKI